MRKVIFIFTLFANSVFYSQNLGLDTSFDTDGKVFNTSISEFPQEIFFEDNKYFFVFDNGFYSINYDGTVNTSFGVNGKIFFNNSTELFLTKGAKMHNGFIYIFGQQSYNSSGTNKNTFIAKISTSGVFDTSFGTNGFMRFDSGVDEEIINDIIINDDGKILAVGTRANTLFVSKINSNGTPDLSFNSVGYKSFTLPSQSFSMGVSVYNYLGNLLLVGSATLAGIKSLIFMKIDSNGNLISSYGNNGLKTTTLAGLGTTGIYTMLKSKLFEDRLYIVYYFGWSFTTQMNQLVKYNLTSDEYSSVSNVPTVKYDYILDSEENIYITGTERCSPTTSSNCPRNYNIHKRNNFGNLDLSFNATGSYSHNFFPGDLYSDDKSSTLFRHPDGKILIAGNIYNPYSPYGVGTSGFAVIRVMDTPLSSNEYKKENISLYPNPVADELNIDTSSDIIILTIEITDVNGRLVYVQNNNNKKIQVDNLKEGVYFLKIKTESFDYVAKFIKN
ncbi:T9SS type A sorting domain-containing protein [Flavobacterium sp.]|uniref:T9SS type A sorting domain-containing protein n=1 Tax=Flavobacterium sp. TaxID=239 RepID=UPI00261635DC|nr:T9SS type A sorting domain-containing protein [Flavobacterium sp.]